MPDLLIAIPAFVFVLGVMIVIHELGHHLVAKYFGVRVLVFSVGFGKRLFGWEHNGTDYRLSLLPFGGYVRMAGENPTDQTTGDPGEFMQHPRWQRVLIALAGPAANIILAVALLTVVYMVHYERPGYLDQPAEIGFVLPESAAAQSGLIAGDRIVGFDGLKDPDWESVIHRVYLSVGSTVEVEALREGNLIQTRITLPSDVSRIGEMTGIAPRQPVIVTAIDETMPGYQAGMRQGDEVLALDSTPVHSLETVQTYLQQSGGNPIEVTLRRGAETLKVTAQPRLNDIGGFKVYQLGFQSRFIKVEQLPFGTALAASLDQNRKYSLLIVELLQRLVERRVSLKQVDGPLGIMRASGEAAQAGWLPLLGLMAAISLNLGILNLLPIPILDGGLIVLTTIEGIMRRDISLQVKERIYQTAFVFLVLFMAVVLYNDFSKLPGLARYLP